MESRGGGDQILRVGETPAGVPMEAATCMPTAGSIRGLGAPPACRYLRRAAPMMSNRASLSLCSIVAMRIPLPSGLSTACVPTT